MVRPMMRRPPPPHFRARPHAGTSLLTISRWLAAGYALDPRGADWLDPDDDAGRRGPIYPAARARGCFEPTPWTLYHDGDPGSDDDAPELVPVAPVEAPRAYRTGPAWEALVSAGGFRDWDSHTRGRWARPNGIRREVEVFVPDGYDWRDEDDE